MPLRPFALAGLLALPALAACATPLPVTFPASAWSPPPAGTPVIPSAKVAEAVEALRKVTGDDGASGTIVVQNGYMLWSGDRIDEKRPVWSCTKSFLSTCLGLLWDDGKLSPDDLLSKHLPELAAAHPAVTLRHLATFTSGVNLKSGELDPGPPDYAPGAAMHYSAQSDILARALTHAAGESLADLFKRRIADPIGMDPAGWEWKNLGERDGIAVNGGSGFPDSGLHMTAQNLARFGWLYANDGVWDGRRLVSQRYIAAATVPLVDAQIPLHEAKGWYHVLPGRYGLNWWTNGIGRDGKRLWPSAPATAFAAQGNRNNICIIVPEWKLVLVRTGLDKIIDVDLYDEALRILGENRPPAAPAPVFAAEPAFFDDFSPGWEKTQRDWRIAAWEQNDTTMSPERCRTDGEGRLVQTVLPGLPHRGGSLQTDREFGHGRWIARVKPSAVPGVLNSIFTVDWDDLKTPEPNDGDKSEIDIEFLTHTFGPGKGSVHLAIHLRADGRPVSHGWDIPLDFNPSDDFHDWGFDILPDGVVWHVDGREIHRWNATETQKINPAYEFFFNSWTGSSGDMGHWIKGPPSEPARYLIDRVAFYPLETVAPAPARAGSPVARR